MGQPQSRGDGAGCAGKEGAGASPTASPYGWWPAKLGEPSLAGSRNACRYAYFAGIRRLAVDRAGRIEVYDTTGFNISGLAPQGADGDALTFASNRGPVRLNAFPRVHGMTPEAGPAPKSKAPTPQACAAAPEAAPAQKPATSDAGSILTLIAQLRHAEGEGHTHRGGVRGQEGRTLSPALSPAVTAARASRHCRLSPHTDRLHGKTMEKQAIVSI